jgi:hypothetical protein
MYIEGRKEGRKKKGRKEEMNRILGTPNKGIHLAGRRMHDAVCGGSFW